MAMYWPPSEATMQRLLELMRKQLVEGKQPDLASLDLAEIEGTDMRKVWEPIARDHPLIQRFATGETGRSSTAYDVV